MRRLTGVVAGFKMSGLREGVGRQCARTFSRDIIASAGRSRLEAVRMGEGMERAKLRLGVDVGGVFAKIIVMDEAGKVVYRASRRHRGNPVAVVKEELRRLKVEGPVAVGITGSYAGLVTGGLNLTPVNFVNAEITAVRRVFPEARNIINVGGSSVTLVQLDEKGNFLDYSTNSLCAAGTGSFLDQQADRLGIRYEDLEGMPHHDSPPPIATRCSVFAKSDLIHRQQEGYDKASLWCGLCKSMTGTLLSTLLRGRPLRGLTVLTGGVSQNAEVMRWLKRRYGDQVQTFDEAAFSGAMGAAEMTNGRVDDLKATVASLTDASQSPADAPRRERLEFRKSVYPSFEVAEEYLDGLDNEVRITRWPGGERVAFYLGIDVGSTSTKAVLMDAGGEVLADVYRRTAGDPVGATRHLFTAIQELGRRKGSVLHVLGAGTTGSGRKLVGKVIGADCIVNEISAHLAGAMHVDERVDTIFEVGGQDAKYIHAKRGRIYDSNMNYVCAAGTGSFVEEQAKKLGFKLEEIGDVVMGIAPPVTSDRCTVFMEQDVDRLLRQGYSREECMAAVLCSVVKNYFTKVVGRRHVNPERVFFQGATARNKGLVAAFERLLDVEMIVSPYCHVMGSYGAALFAKETVCAGGGATGFKGLDLSSRRITLRTERCELCQNRCVITFVDIEGESESPSWGYMCGRDPDATSVRRTEEFDAFRIRERLLFKGRGAPRSAAKAAIGIPRSLINWSLYPLWEAFFGALGFRVILSDRTDAEVVRLGNEIAAADFCFPVKVAHGHALALSAREDVDFVFLPHAISEERNARASNSYFCPYVEALPSLLRSALKVHGANVSKLLTAIVDFSFRPKEQMDELMKGLGEPLGVGRKEVRRAWAAGLEALRTFKRRRREEGLKILRRLERSGERALAIIGRPYNTCDLGSNLALPQKIAELGLTVIPMDMLPYDIEKLNPIWGNMYWAYGQHILAAAEFVRNRKNLFGLYFSNFSCGPDSFLLSFVEEIMGEKPLLTLELDEHGGDAGYMTRIEAFLDVVRNWEAREQGPFRVEIPKIDERELKRRKVWVPNMHVIGGPLYEAAFQAAGYEAESLPPETHESFDLGRSLTRGSECLPTACTTGAFVDTLRRRRLSPEGQTLFMPTADGPCRFGQYAMLQRLVLNRLGQGEAAILSPSSRNNYMGLSNRLRFLLWQAILAGDIIFKAVCKVRPYEISKGETDGVLAEEMERIAAILRKGGDIKPHVQAAIERIAAVPTTGMGTRPLVGVVGEIYVRCNPYSNDRLIRAIEEYGGEAWLSPISEWVLYSAELHRWSARKRPLHVWELLKAWAKNKFLAREERKYADLASDFLGDRREPEIEEVIAEGGKLVPVNFLGEAILTLGRASLFARQGASLVVNAAPFACMPGTITSALCREIQAETRMPIVSMFYDGEEGMNQRLEVFLASMTAKRGRR